MPQWTIYFVYRVYPKKDYFEKNRLIYLVIKVQTRVKIIYLLRVRMIFINVS